MTNSNEPKTLKDVALAALRRHDVTGGRELDRVAKAAGLTISYTTVDKIVAGTYTSRPTRPTLDALAALSGVEPRQVYKVADVPFPVKPLAELLPDGADTLTASQKRVVVEVVRQFAESNRALRNATRREEVGSRGDSAPTKTAGERPAASDRFDLAADVVRRPSGKTLKQEFNAAQDADAERGDYIPEDDVPA